jgi:hypothetical protein
MQKRTYDKDLLANRARKRGVVAFPILIIADGIVINFPDGHGDAPRPTSAQQRPENSSFAALAASPNALAKDRRANPRRGQAAEDGDAPDTAREAR